MTKRNEAPTTPPESETSAPAENDAPAPAAKPVNPKEAEYQRSKDDLARKRREMRRKSGRR